jgi:hypothetical protein
LWSKKTILCHYVVAAYQAEKATSRFTKRRGER